MKKAKQLSKVRTATHTCNSLLSQQHSAGTAEASKQSTKQHDKWVIHFVRLKSYMDLHTHLGFQLSNKLSFGTVH